MYNVQVNEKGFYMGSYATVGTVKDGINVPALPPTEDALCYKLIDKEVQKEVQQPILQYSKLVESETEFETHYSLKSTDEDGNEIETPITAEEYEAFVDKSDVNVVQIPKMVTAVLSQEEFTALSDEEKEGYMVAYKEDENGELVYETIIVTEIVKDWEFSQEKYDELLAIKTAQEEESARRSRTLSLEQQRADIDYIALMTGVDLEV